MTDRTQRLAEVLRNIFPEPALRAISPTWAKGDPFMRLALDLQSSGVDVDEEDPFDPYIPTMTAGKLAAIAGSVGPDWMVSVLVGGYRKRLVLACTWNQDNNGHDAGLVLVIGPEDE